MALTLTARARWMASLALPFTVPWVRRHQSRIREEGEPLSEKWKGLAAEIGVLDWEEVRFLVVDEVPLPAQGPLKWFSKMARQELLDIGGMTLGPSIYLTPQVLCMPEVLAHELVHVRQYERLGGVAPFLRRYFEEYLVYGYEDSPLELEANTRARMAMADKDPWEFMMLRSEDGKASAAQKSEPCEEPAS